jgi:hypothetical protein
MIRFWTVRDLYRSIVTLLVMLTTFSSQSGGRRFVHGLSTNRCTHAPVNPALGDPSTGSCHGYNY